MPHGLRVCLRLKAAVEAAAGRRVAERRAELEQEAAAAREPRGTAAAVAQRERAMEREVQRAQRARQDSQVLPEAIQTALGLQLMQLQALPPGMSSGTTVAAEMCAGEGRWRCYSAAAFGPTTSPAPAPPAAATMPWTPAIGQLPTFTMGWHAAPEVQAQQGPRSHAARRAARGKSC